MENLSKLVHTSITSTRSHLARPLPRPPPRPPRLTLLLLCLSHIPCPFLSVSFSDQYTLRSRLSPRPAFLSTAYNKRWILMIRFVDVVIYSTP